MDERKQRAKALKQAYGKERRRRTLLWDIFSWLLGLCALGGLCFGLYVYVPWIREAVCPVWYRLRELLGLETGSLFPLAADWALPAAGVLGVLWLLVRIFRRAAAARAKKCDAYLSLQTLRRTLKAEKEEASL